MNLHTGQGDDCFDSISPRFLLLPYMAFSSAGIKGNVHLTVVVFGVGSGGWALDVVLGVRSRESGLDEVIGVGSEGRALKVHSL